MSRPIELGSFSLKVTDLVSPGGLRLDEVELHGEGAKLSTKPFDLEMGSAGSIVARISADSVKQYLESKAPQGVGEFSVKLVDGLIEVASSVRILLVEMRGTARCSLSLEGGKKLIVTLESLDVSAPAARTLVESQVERVNPVFDATDFPLDVELESVEVSDRFVSLRGRLLASARVPSSP